jgi:hypothetical protein
VSDYPTIRQQPSEEEQPGLFQKLEGFEHSEELEAVADLLIGRHTRLRYLEDYPLAYLLHHTDPPEKPHDVGSARKVSGWQRALTQVDGAVILNAPVWLAIAQEQREALVLHQLLHFGQHEKTGALLIVPHDVEEFGLVAATYGAWRPSLRDFAEQLSMGLGAGPSADGG